MKYLQHTRYKLLTRKHTFSCFFVASSADSVERLTIWFVCFDQIVDTIEIRNSGDE